MVMVLGAVPPAMLAPERYCTFLYLTTIIDTCIPVARTVCFSVSVLNGANIRARGGESGLFWGLPRGEHVLIC